MSIRVEATSLPGVVIIEPPVFGDSRGHFKELFKEASYAEIGVDSQFVQDNFSRSIRGVLRGLHFQVNTPQGKLVSCLRGSVFDVAVDIDPSSPTYREWVGVELSDENHRQLWIPPGYAHGFCVLSESADFFYKCTAPYDPTDEAGIFWADESIGVEWPVRSPSLSDKDVALPTLADFWASRQ